ncbi:BTB/POZ protein [Baffinella frigidus]|nr:BTB/POZ protein [Cryptophyta sp. CCMP2293]
MEGGVRPPSGGGAAGGSDAGGAAHGNVPRLVAADDAFFHRESLGLSMQALREAGTFCDATVLVGGRTFHVHRVVIAGGSEVLAAMFTAGLREGKTQTAELPEMDAASFETLLRFLYTGNATFPSPDAAPVLAVLKAADRKRPQSVHMRRSCL